MLLHEKLSPYHLILASASPRRRALLKDLGLTFSLAPNHDLEENYPDGMLAQDVPVYLAARKSDTFVSGLNENDILITADTIVILHGQIIGKPASKEEAVNMLSRLSGNTHTVITGVCLRTRSNQHCFSDRSEVIFRKLTEEEIRYYVDHYRPFDKAGAYGIQEWIGYVAIEEIRGSFYNVMGLPVQKLYIELGKFADNLGKPAV